jgi:hypothetical protein
MVYCFWRPILNSNSTLRAVPANKQRILPQRFERLLKSNLRLLTRNTSNLMGRFSGDFLAEGLRRPLQRIYPFCDTGGFACSGDRRFVQSCRFRMQQARSVAGVIENASRRLAVFGFKR